MFLLLDSPSCSEFLFHRHCRATHLLRVIARFSENLVLRPFLFGEQSGTERWIRHTVRASALRAELLPLAPPPRVWFIAHLFTLFYSLIFNLFALSFYTWKLKKIAAVCGLLFWCLLFLSLFHRVCFILNPKREQAVEREGGARVLMCGGEILQLPREGKRTLAREIHAWSNLFEGMGGSASGKY